MRYHLVPFLTRDLLLQGVSQIPVKVPSPELRPGVLPGCCPQVAGDTSRESRWLPAELLWDPVAAHGFSRVQRASPCPQSHLLGQGKTAFFGGVFFGGGGRWFGCCVVFGFVLFLFLWVVVFLFVLDFFFFFALNPCFLVFPQAWAGSVLTGERSICSSSGWQEGMLSWYGSWVALCCCPRVGSMLLWLSLLKLRAETYPHCPWARAPG